MKKLTALFLTLAMLFAVTAVNASAEDAMVYGTATLTYAEFYSGDVSSVESFDAVTSATTGKSGMFPNAHTDFVDAETNPDGYRILGVSNVNVAVAESDLEAYQALNDTFVVTGSEAPAQYKTVTIEDGKAVYSATHFNVADAVVDAEIEVLTDSHWGDYQINIKETSTQYIRNTREDEGFAISSGVQGVIVETASGLKVGMEHLQSIWVQPWEISWNVSVNNAGNPEMTYDNMPELDRLMGETVTKVTFINADSAYIYEFDGAYLPVMFETSLTVDNAAAASGATAVAVTNLPDDYAAAYTVSGLTGEVADGQLTWTDALPGSYTLTLSDDSGVYAPKSAAFILSTDVLPVAFDADSLTVVPAEGADEALAQAFIANLASVTVNDKTYSASGRGAVVVINTEGELDTEAAAVSGRGADATSTPVFAESGEYTITAASTGFDNALTFTVTIE